MFANYIHILYFSVNTTVNRQRKASFFYSIYNIYEIFLRELHSVFHCNRSSLNRTRFRLKNLKIFL